MIRKIATTLVIGAALVLSASTAFADSWLPAQVEQFTSADGTWKLTVFPRALDGPLAYFQDKVDGKERAGAPAGNLQARAVGQLERERNGHWQTVWKRPLANDVSPVEVIVSNSGVAVTFDNWHSTGYGEDAVVIYAADGRRVRAFGLQAFLPEHYIEGLPHSVSSIRWRGKPRIDEARGQLVIPVIVPTPRGQVEHDDEPRHVDVRFQLVDGVRVPATDHSWQDALASAKAAEAARNRARDERYHKFVSPLAAPSGRDTRAWYAYLDDAFRRMHLDLDAFPAVKVVPPRGSPDHAKLVRYLGDALCDDGADFIVVGSPSQEALIAALRAQAVRAKPASLKRAQVYVAADDAHMPAARAALAHTQAKVVQIDIAKPIPQRRSQIERVRREAAAEG